MQSQLIVFVFSITFLFGCRKEAPSNALRTAFAMEEAVNNYLTEYSSMPYPGTVDHTLLTSTDTKLLDILQDREDAMNKRSINFLSVRKGEKLKNGMIYTNDLRVVGLFDSWGSGYNVRLDLDSDQKIDARGETLKNRRVAVWSNGPDRKSGTKDDVKTW